MGSLRIAVQQIKYASLANKAIRVKYHVLTRLQTLSKKQAAIIFLVTAVIIVVTLALPVRAAIVFRSASSADNGSGTTSLVIPKPSGLQVGDLMVANITQRATNGFTHPSGWTFLGNQSISTQFQMQIAYKIATSADIAATNFTWTISTSTKAAGGITAYSGVDTADPIGAWSSNQSTSNLSTMSAPTITTARTNSVILAAFAQPLSTSFTADTGTTQRFQVASSGGGNASSKVTIAAADKTIASSGANTSMAMATAAADATDYMSTIISINPASPSTLTQSAYRWFTNVDAANFSTINTNASTAADAIYAATNDTDHLYSTGYVGTNGNDWRIEKRKLSDGSLVSGFGSGGYVDSNVSANDDRAWDIEQDASYIYVVGQDASIASSNTQWRIEKRDKTTGALVSGFGSSGVVQFNPTSGVDSAKDIEIDDTYLYIVGYDNTGAGQWRIEKRDKTTGALVSGFGSSGVVVSDFAATLNDEATSVVLEGENLYIGGFDRTTGSSNSQWRIEKRDRTTGALVSGFGSGGVVTENPFTGNAGSVIEDGVVHHGLIVEGGYLFATGTQGVSGSTDMQWRTEKRDLTTGALIAGFGTSGVVNTDPGTGIDNPTAIRSNGTSLFIGGFDRTLDGGMSQWRIEKRDLASGAFVTTFGAGGSITSNPSTGHDELRDLVISGDNLYATGYDIVPGNYQWRTEKRNTLNGNGPSDHGTPRAALNTPATSVAVGEQVRLRLLLRVGTSQLNTSDQSFRLQFAEQSGTCDAGFSGESYSNLTNNSTFAMHNNANLSDSSTLYMNVNDPTDGANPVLLQAYDEFETFSNSASAIPVNSNGLWDISITNYSAPLGKTYCFRVVDSTGTPVAGYEQIAELSTPPAPQVEQGSYRLYQNTDSSSPGAPLAAQDTAASVASEVPFRLRQLLTQTVGSTPISTAFRLQAGEKVTSCSAASYEYLAAGATQTSTGIQYSGSSFASVDDGNARYVWSNPEYADVIDTTYATATAGAINDYTEILQATGYGFQIPSDATINGIELTYSGGGSQSVEHGFWIMKNGTVLTGDNRAIGAFSTRTEGSSTDLWSTTWAPADINNGGFGFALKGHVSYDSVSGKSGTIRIDAMGINVYYSLPAIPAAIAAHNNASLSDGATVVASGTDPIPSSGAVVLQTYQEDDAFSTSSSIATGENGLWDFSLIGDSTTNGKTYCFRVVKNDGSLLSSYTQYPEVTFESGGGSPSPDLSQQVRGGQSVIDGIKSPFSW